MSDSGRPGAVDPAGRESATGELLRDMADELERAVFPARGSRTQEIKAVAADLRSLADLADSPSPATTEAEKLRRQVEAHKAAARDMYLRYEEAHQRFLDLAGSLGDDAAVPAAAAVCAPADGARLDWALQSEVSTWLHERVGPNPGLLANFKKLGEEVLELGDAVQGSLGFHGLSGPPEGWSQNLRDETADVVIVCMSIAVTEGFDLADAVAEKWARRKRGPWVAADPTDDEEESSDG